MTDFDLLYGAIILMFSVPMYMMAYDSCEHSVFDEMKERKLAEKRRIREAIREMGKAMNQ